MSSRGFNKLQFLVFISLSHHTQVQTQGQPAYEDTGR